MLTEDEVVKRICTWLESNGHEVRGFRLGTQKGHDIDALDEDGVRLLVECKGDLSPIKKSVFSKSQQWKRISGAVFNQLKLRLGDDNIRVGIALPLNSHYPELMDGLRDWASSLSIEVYWVSDDGLVHKW